MMYAYIGLAVVTEVQMTKTGFFVTLEGSGGEELKARVLRPDSGPGYGFHTDLEVEDTVLWACPDGDPGDGVYILGTWHEEAEPAPDAAIAQPKDRVWRAKNGTRIRLQTSGADLNLELLDGKRLNLGADSLTEPVVKGVAQRDAWYAWLDSLSSAINLLPIAATDPATTMALVNAIRALLVALAVPTSGTNAVLKRALQSALSEFVFTK